MKTILVPTEPNAQMRSTLETALLVARDFNSYIEGFAVRVAVPNVPAMDAAPSGSLAFIEEENAEATRQSRELFESFMREHGVSRPREPQNAPTYGWRIVDLVGHRGRVFDLIVIGRPSVVLDLVQPAGPVAGTPAAVGMHGSMKSGKSLSTAVEWGMLIRRMCFRQVSAEQGVVGARVRFHEHDF